ncbi:MAG: rRNA maturation RNase YbeY [Candidatus Krumholzibacteria bacterium]|nr:rRNA maturation RNase YbeY [Candidatus Krumholzibacteria bacterium]
MILTLVDRRTAADGTSPEFHGENWARLQRLAAGVGCADWPVDVVLVDVESMTDLNERFRDKQGVTDILSFSYLENEGEGAAALVRGEGFAAADLWLAAEMIGPEAGDAVGELVLAPGFIGERCAQNDWPQGAEIPMLVVHGCLHLVGWDHQEADQLQAMQDHEVSILTGEGLAHPLRQRS